ncbi:hypothetical protein DIPPA_30833 [Diplonema papillatum]|nr:hypothetical protein DIPPA_30833 [Diplonema papillatum]
MFLTSVRDLQTSVGELPMVGRLALLSMAPLTLVLTISFTDGAIQASKADEARQQQLHPQLIKRVRALVDGLEQEQMAAAELVGNGTTTRNATEFNSATKAADALLVEAVVFSYKSSEQRGTRSFGEVFPMNKLLELRSYVNLATVTPTEVLIGYGDVIKTAGRAVLTLEESKPWKKEETSPAIATVCLLYAEATLRLHAAVLALAVNHTSSASDGGLELHQLEMEASGMNSVFYDAFTTLAAADTKRRVASVLESAAWGTIIAERIRTANEFRFSTSLDVLGGDWRSGAAEATELLARSSQGLSDTAASDVDALVADVSFQGRVDIVLCAVAFVFLLVLATLAGLRKRNADVESARKKALQLMVETVNRVAEYASHFSMFDLTVPMLPHGKTLTTLELALMRCMAGLKVVAPALPPELFPERYVIKNEKQCAMEVMMCQLPKHHTEIRGTLTKLLDKTDVTSSKAIVLMMERAKFGMRETEASLLTVSFTWLHDPVDDDASCNQPSMHKNIGGYICLVEAATTRHNGLVHCLCGDRMISAWNVSLPIGNHPLLACKAALSILPGTANFQQPTTNLHVASAVTFGTVVVGNIGFLDDDVLAMSKTNKTDSALGTGTLGSGGFKTFAIYGPAVELGGRISFYQKLYNSSTAVFCDDEIANRVCKELAVKPVEPVRLSDLDDTIVSVFSIMGERNSEEAESQALFKVAYDLFIQRKFLEAEKAFCHFTKVFGYDNVVERLQKLVSLGKTMDETCAKDIDRLN